MSPGGGKKSRSASPVLEQAPPGETPPGETAAPEPEFDQSPGPEEARWPALSRAKHICELHPPPRPLAPVPPHGPPPPRPSPPSSPPPPGKRQFADVSDAFRRYGTRLV